VSYTPKALNVNAINIVNLKLTNGISENAHTKDVKIGNFKLNAITIKARASNVDLIKKNVYGILSISHQRCKPK
jgi:hypothetical protein